MRITIKIFLLAISFFSTIYSYSQQVTIGSELIPNAGALLDLKQYNKADNTTSDKGFNLPRVPLNVIDKLEPCATTNATNAAAHKGLLVYNMTDNSYVAPGIYYWDGSNWQRLVNKYPSKGISIHNLRTTINSVATAPTASQNGAILSFGDTYDSATGRYYINITDPGSYSFNLRLYGDGTIQSGKTAGRASVYITLLVNGVKVDQQEVTCSLVNPSASGATNIFTATVMLRGNMLSRNDKVEFAFAHSNEGVYYQTVKLNAGTALTGNKTTLIFWRI